MGRFETQWLAAPANLPALADLPGQWARKWCHGRYVAFQMAEVAIPRQMFQEILRLIAELRPHHPPALA